MKLARLLWLILCTATVTLAPAQEEPKDKGADKKPAAAAKEEKDPALSHTEHEITIGGKTIKYWATAGYLVLKNERASRGPTFSSLPTPRWGKTTPRSAR